MLLFIFGIEIKESYIFQRVFIFMNEMVKLLELQNLFGTFLTNLFQRQRTVYRRGYMSGPPTDPTETLPASESNTARPTARFIALSSIGLGIVKPTPGRSQLISV